MINKLSTRLGIKLFILLTAVISVSIIPLIYVSLKAVRDYGNKAFSVHEKQINEHTFSYLQSITRERAHLYQVFFDGIAASAGLLGSHASEIYSDLEFYAGKPLQNYDHNFQNSNGLWTNTLDDPVISIYWGAREISDDSLRELQALTHMTPAFSRVLEEHPFVQASHVISLSGIGQYYTKSMEAKQAALNLPSPTDFDLRDGEPITIFTKSEKTTRDVRWTNVYKDDVIDGLMLTASAPIFDNRTQEFKGISGIDVPLDTIIDDILDLNRPEFGESILFSFLVDRNGRLIAFPQSYLTQFGLLFDPKDFTDSSDSLDISLADSTNSEVRALANIVAKEQASLTHIEIDSNSYVIATSRMTELGWVYGMVVEKEALFTSVDESRRVLENVVRELELDGIVLGVMTIIIALMMVFLSLKYLVTPLRNLATATKLVADGDLSVRCPVGTKDEIGVLAASFNVMVERLEVGQEQERKYANALETEVKERDQELLDKRGELEDTIELLNEEVEQRQIISEALRLSQQQYYETLEANRAGIYIIVDNVFQYVNNSLAEMMYASQEQLIGRDPLELISEEDRSFVAKNMERRFLGADIAPYRVKCVRLDGSEFHGEVWAKVTAWQGKVAMVGTITDVSVIKRNEEKLQIQEVQLRKSLDEKETLLKEIYHRTKNNMLVIISLLELQASDINDQRITSIFNETENRIRAMALVHEKLYQSQNLSEIDLRSYLEDIVSSLIDNMAPVGKISLTLDVESSPINIDFAVPLGLAINEIVTNSIKHAFPGNRSGIVTIKLSEGQGDEVVLVVGDDGVGLSEKIDIQKGQSFGMLIVKNLIETQLNGTVELKGNGGTWYRISFQKPDSGKRI